MTMRVRALCCCRSTLAKSLGQYCLRRFLLASRSPIEKEDAIKSALHIQEKSVLKIPSNAFMPAKRAKNLTLQKRRQWVLYLARERAPFSRLWSRPALLLFSCGFTSQSMRRRRATWKHVGALYAWLGRSETVLDELSRLSCILLKWDSL